MYACHLSHRELFTIVACFVSLPCQAQAPPAIDWNTLPDEKLSLTVRAQPPGGAPSTIEGKVLFSRNYAVSLTLDPEARYEDGWKEPVVFDLVQLTWYQENAKQWIPIAKCREWEKASLEKSRASLARERDPNLRAFVEATMNPQFQQRQLPDGGLELSNSHLTYVISPEPNVAAHQPERFIRYDQINAYHKAMTSTRMPPTAQIAVDRALFESRLFPKQLTATIKTGKGNLTFTTDIRIEAFTPTDADQMRNALAIITP